MPHGSHAHPHAPLLTAGVVRVQDQEGRLPSVLVERDTQQRVGEHAAADHDGRALRRKVLRELPRVAGDVGALVDGQHLAGQPATHARRQEGRRMLSRTLASALECTRLRVLVSSPASRVRTHALTAMR